MLRAVVASRDGIKTGGARRGRALNPVGVRLAVRGPGIPDPKADSSLRSE